jgi:hypothetical protein
MSIGSCEALLLLYGFSRTPTLHRVHIGKLTLDNDRLLALIARPCVSARAG